MRNRFYPSVCLLLLCTLPAAAQRQWLVFPSRFDGDSSAPFIDVPAGDFDGRGYKYSSGGAGNIQRAWWELSVENCIPVGHSDLFPVKPALYHVFQWSPSVMPEGITYWDWLPIECNINGREANEQGPGLWNIPFIPWSGAYGQNHQWIGMDFPYGVGGVWIQAGPGPQAPANPTCAAPGNGLHMWMKRNSALWTKWDFGFCFPCTHPITAILLQEAYPVVRECDAPTAGGPLDLRCIGNADPLYGPGEVFANNPDKPQQTVTIDGQQALAANNYAALTCVDPGYPMNVPLSPGLPANGLYTVHLADRDVLFRLRYDGFNAIKWRSGDTLEFPPDRVFRLNDSAATEFVPGNYRELFLLTASSGGRGHHLNIELVYDDQTSQVVPINLYDWSGQDGDAANVAVGVGGNRRTQGAAGFRTVGKEGDSVEHGMGGTTDGQFLITHRVPVDPCRTLERISISTDFRSAPTEVVESRPGGVHYERFAAAGNWTAETAKSTAHLTTPGIGSLSAPSGASGTTAVFSFTPTVTGYYRVQATWAQNLDAARQAAFVITHDGPPVTVYRNQRNDGNGWQHLEESVYRGQYHLTAGSTYTVTLNAGLSGDGPRVFADAVRWEMPGINTSLLAATLETGRCCHTPWADADGDGDVDGDDFAFLQRCLTLGGGVPSPGLCACLDSDNNQAIDATDLQNFAACAMGPGVVYEYSVSPPHWPNWPAGCPNQPAP